MCSIEGIERYTLKETKEKSRVRYREWYRGLVNDEIIKDCL